jgi:hypothetical protein
MDDDQDATDRDATDDDYTGTLEEPREEDEGGDAPSDPVPDA